MRYAIHADESLDGRLFDAASGCELFSQRLLRLGAGAEPRRNADADEVLYVVTGSARATIDGAEHDLRPGTAVFVARGTGWSADGDAAAVSVLVHEPEAASRAHAVLDLAAAGRERDRGQAVHPRRDAASGCASVTQFIGLIPPGRAPDHFHTYDEVLYVLEGEGLVEIGGEQAPLRPGSCVHLPARLVHCLANTGDSELRVLGVFRPAGSPAEAYYPDGTLAVVPTEE